MKNLLTVLKKLGKKMTGSDIAGTNLVTVVDDIANKYTGGSGGGGEGGCDCTLVVGMTVTGTVDGVTQTLDKTWQEIYDALAADKRVILKRVVQEGIEIAQGRIFDAEFIEDDTVYIVGGCFQSHFVEYTTDSAAGYPYRIIER